jgi:WD40 repeat protein
MSDVRELLRRGVGDYVPEPDGFELVLRRRERKQRNRRVGAGVVVAVIVAIGAAIFISQYRNDPVPATPILRPPSGWFVFSATEHGPATRESPRDLFVAGEGIAPQLVAGRPGDTTDQFCGAIAPNGTTLAYLSMEGGFLGQSGGVAQLVIAPLEDDGSLGTPTVRREIQPDEINACPRWTPDGSRLAVIDGGRVLIVGEDGTATTLQGISGATDLTWSPDGTQLAVRQGSTVSIVGDGSPHEVASGLGGEDVGQLAWSADGLAIGAAEPSKGGDPATARAFIRLVNPSTGDSRDVRVGPYGWVDNVTWLPDGRIVFTDSSGSVKVVDPRGTTEPSVLLRGRLLGFALSPDGRSIVVKELSDAASPLGGYGFVVVPVDGGPSQQLVPDSWGAEYADFDW